MKKLAIVILLVSMTASAQQDPQYTQYMYNMNVVNPAYAGLKENLSVTTLYRKQWSGLDGAPTTFTLSGHSPVGDKVGLGISAVKDELGPVNETNVFVDFSYTLQLGESTNLALGIKAGGTFHDIGLATLDLQDLNDPFFSQDISSATPNVGAGAFLYGDNYYFGVSVPNMLKSVHLDENGMQYGSEVSHYFVTAGYVFQVSDDVKLKPSTMLKSAFGAPLSMDLNLNALFFEKFEVGTSYRTEDSFSGLIGFQVAPYLRIGYAYDHIVSELSAIAPASHEVVITFDLKSNPKTLRSPRYF
ncbi:MAG: type IX secretion system membrane protein PorP/SprF [Flavobacteriaceae bacterium]|nr:type IX secretion system membrane protein PorP/SprF [Flavobacteriaceae bacterium]MDG1962768.1 type IX secretion system membrane protein PorP/SprF [Flavobacteriaceae bacterium]